MCLKKSRKVLALLSTASLNFEWKICTRTTRVNGEGILAVTVTMFNESPMGEGGVDEALVACETVTSGELETIVDAIAPIL